MNNLAENIMDFKKDFENFKQYILLNKSDDEIRKEYLKLLKKYHPDSVCEENKEICEEYTTELLLFYEDYKNNRICFQNKSVSEDNSLNIKLMKIARDEYTEFKKREIKNRWKIDPEARDYLGNAVRCYEKFIKECKNPEIVKAAKVQLKWIRPFYNLQNRNLVDVVMKEIIEKRKIQKS